MSDLTEKLTSEEVQRMIRELHEAQKKTERSMKEVHKAQQKTEESLQRLEKSLNKASGNFNNKWGAFMEQLIVGDLVSLLQEWDIPVEKVTQRKRLYRTDRTEFDEYDLIAYNGDSIVVVEVKTTLTEGKVDRFLGKLANFKKENSEYEGKRVLGGVGFLEAEENPARYAEECGLFVIHSPGGESNASVILNDKKTFKPESF